MSLYHTLRSFGLLALLAVHVGIAATPNKEAFDDAVDNNKLEDLNNLLNTDPKPSVEFLNKHSFLHTACYKGYQEITEALLKAGADVDHQAFGCTPLYRAVQYEHKEIVETLIQYKANLDIQDATVKQTSLHLAVLKKNLAITKLLVQNNANLNIQETLENQTPLHMAIDTKNYHYAIVEVLVNNGAKLDIQDDEGKTPLHLALERGYNKIAELLINKLVQSGVKLLDIEDDGKQTPLKIAQLRHNNKMIQLLQSKMTANDVPSQDIQDNTNQGGTNNDVLRPNNNGNANNLNLPTKIFFTLLVLVALGAIYYFVAPKEETPKQHKRRAAQEARYQAAQQPLPYQGATTQPWAYPIAQPA